VAQGVEVREPILVLVGDAGGLQVGFHGIQDRPTARGEDGPPPGPPGQPGAQEGRQGGLDGLHVAAAALAIPGLDRDRGTGAIQVERLRGQGLHLLGAEPRPGCDAVEHGAVGAAEPALGGAAPGGRDQPLQLGHREGAALAAAIRLGMLRGLQVGQQVLASPAVAPQPPREVLGQPGVVIDGPQGQPLVFQGRQRRLRAGQGQVGRASGLGQRDQPGDAGAGRIGMLSGIVLAQQEGVPLLDVILQRPGLVSLVCQVLLIDPPAANAILLILDLARQLLSHPPVGGEPLHLPVAVGVGVAEIPDLATLDQLAGHQTTVLSLARLVSTLYLG
jgi:hypothetical protein